VSPQRLGGAGAPPSPPHVHVHGSFYVCAHARVHTSRESSLCAPSPDFLQHAARVQGLRGSKYPRSLTPVRVGATVDETCQGPAQVRVRAMPCTGGICQIGRRCGTTRHCPSPRPGSMAELIERSSKAEKGLRSTRHYNQGRCTISTWPRWRATLPFGSGATPPRASPEHMMHAAVCYRFRNLLSLDTTVARLRYVMYRSESSARTVFIEIQHVIQGVVL